MKATRRAALILVALGLLAFASPAAADRVYFSNGSGIFYADLDTGAGAKLEVSGAATTNVHGIAIDPAAGKIYWSGEPSGPVIGVANLDGSGGGALSTSGAPINHPYGLGLDAAAGRVYWGNYQGPGGRIAYADTDDSGGGEISTTGAMAGNVLGIALDLPDSRIYWTNENGPLSYANLDGSGGANVNLTGASTGPGFYKGAAIDPVSRRIFWTKYKNASPYEPVVSSAALDESGGSDLETPGAPEEFTEGVAIDPTARRLYWANPGFFLSAGIYYAALDGSGAHKLNISGIPVAGANFPTLLKAPLGTGVPKLTAQIALRPRFLTCDEGTWAGNLPQAQVYRAPRSISYQWLKDGQPVAGATRSNIGVEGSPGGDYACQVTATNAGGSTTQTSATQFVCCPTGPKATAARVVPVKGGMAQLKLTCPDGVDPCAGRLHLESTRPPRRARSSARKKPKLPNLPVTYGEKSFSVPAGTTKTVKVKLSKRAKSRLRDAKGHRLKAALGGSGVESRTVLLKSKTPIPKRR